MNDQLLCKRLAYTHYGDLSAVGPKYSVFLYCDNCKVSWDGCCEVFQCPECGQGKPPIQSMNAIMETILKDEHRY